MKSSHRKKTGKVTLADVAKSVGVSTMTISRALREPDKVATALKERIFTAIDELGYVPNSAASHLASAKSRLIVLVVSSFSATGFREFYSAFSNVLKKKGYRLIVESLQNESDYTRFTYDILSYNPEAIVFLYVNGEAFNSSVINNSAIPIFSVYSNVLDGQQQQTHTFDASLDNAITHLLERGKQDIGFLVMEDNDNHYLNNHLLTAWNRAMLRNNRAPNQLIYHNGPTEPTSVYSTLETVAKTWPDVDALICSHAMLAYSCLQYARRNGISVPQQLAVLSLIDDQTPYFQAQRCTHIEIPFATVGRRVAENIIAVIVEHQSPQALQIEPHLVNGVTT